MPSQDSVAVCLEEMDRLYKRCLDLTNALLEMDPLPLDQRLEDFIRDRAEILTRISDTEHGLPIRRQSGRAVLNISDPVQSERIESLIKALRDRLMAIIEADRRLGEKICETMAQTGDDLKRLRLGQAILKAYTPAPMRPVYLDRHG
jgi:hypothetical protein